MWGKEKEELKGSKTAELFLLQKDKVFSRGRNRISVTTSLLPHRSALYSTLISYSFLVWGLDLGVVGSESTEVPYHCRDRKVEELYSPSIKHKPGPTKTSKLLCSP